MKKELSDLRAEARQMKLIYVTDKTIGYSRLLVKNAVTFFDCDGHEITDEDTLKRLRGLVLPPAWQNVWICTKPNGHLQATGFDKLGRKQYRYHTNWSLIRNEKKHDRMLEFGVAIPQLRKQLEKDLRKKQLSKEKVIALALSLLEHTFIRIGNDAYAKKYNSHGLTTLRNKHIKINGSKFRLSFTGKKGIIQDIEVSHLRLAKLMKKLRDLPGQELFQYLEADGSRNSIDSGMVNDYIRQYTGNDFTAKDFRTWAGTVNALVYLSGKKPFESATEAKRNINEALDFVALQLGNTRTVCKKYYVHPALLGAYEEGRLFIYLKKLSNLNEGSVKSKMQKTEERVLLNFLRKEGR
ncbi:DNA topoisomerase IB [Solitalea canadensis]|uniref:DNA topoisomerase n=1 Tax=Solitalea canadensis (strain ATCC 29591 / DSM 3403 / JCM 21819 / LMG 8368 / NBRC 15130 / NCIMB 12057 / USAM 9D) TaxID=929556 RepID=H8KVG2_SOLCM|nr:DNA topoisomerase IB [Solitalea canadensis]AFD06342.1 topoisomerase IB [Solitalea canadensis DSM 3403]